MSGNADDLVAPLVGDTLGMLLIGGVASALLYGINCVQAFSYYQHSVFEHRKFVIMVGVLMFLNALHVAFMVKTLDYYLIRHFGDNQALFFTDWSLSLQTLLTVASNSIVRMFFTYRIWILSGRSLMHTFPKALLAFLGTLSGFGFSIVSFIDDSFEDMRSVSWLVYASFSLAIASDVYVTCYLCYFFYINRTGVKTTDSALKVLMLYCINAGILVTCCNISCFVTFAVLPGNYSFMAIFFVSSKIYLCSLLATLNCKDVVRPKMNDAGLVPIVNESMEFAPRSHVGRFSGRREPEPIGSTFHIERVTISVEQEIETKVT